MSLHLTNLNMIYCKSGYQYAMSSDKSFEDKVKTIFTETIKGCYIDISEATIWSYSEKERREWGVPTINECRRITALYKRILDSDK